MYAEPHLSALPLARTYRVRFSEKRAKLQKIFDICKFSDTFFLKYCIFLYFLLPPLVFPYLFSLLPPPPFTFHFSIALPPSVPSQPFFSFSAVCLLCPNLIRVGSAVPHPISHPSSSRFRAVAESFPSRCRVVSESFPVLHRMITV